MNPSDNFIPLQDGAAYTSSSEQEMACAPGPVRRVLQALTVRMGHSRPHHLLLQGRMLLFSLISEGCLMHILACSFNKHVIRLPKLSTTDTPPRRGWQNSVWPRHGPLCVPHYSEVVRCDSKEHETYKKWGEAKTEPSKSASSSDVLKFSESSSGPCLSSKDKMETRTPRG